MKDELRWAIEGCTPDDVLKLHGERFGFTREDAEVIAERVNEAVGSIDDLFYGELFVQTHAYLIERNMERENNALR